MRKIPGPEGKSYTEQDIAKMSNKEQVKLAMWQRSHGGRQDRFERTGSRIPAGYDMAIMENYTPQQRELFGSSFEHLGPQSYTARLARGDQSLFNEMEEPSMREFNALQGQTASRFSGMGQGGRRSSNFQNQMSQANMDFASQLASRRQQLRTQAVQDLMGMTHTMLGERPFETALVEKPNFKKGDKTDYVSGFGGAAFGALGGYFAGDPVGGAKVGWEVGKQLRTDKYGQYHG